MSTSTDIVQHFADFAANTQYDSLPAEAVDAAKKSVLDTLGVILAASGMEPAVRGVIDIVRETGGQPECTLMAEKDVSGTEALFEGRYGFFKTYFDGRYDRAGILKDLGRDYKGGRMLYKRWPSVGTAHSHMQATIDIITVQNLQPADIAEIRLFVGDYHDLMCRPLEVRQAPETVLDAKFSLPFLVAVAAVRRGMSVTDFTEMGIKDPEILAAARKVVPAPDSNLDWKLELPPGRVEIVTEDGRRFERIGNNVPGSAECSMIWDDMARKFAECAAVAVLPPSLDKVRKAQDLAKKLETLEDATELLRVLA